LEFFIIDAKREEIAVREAKKLNIPIVGFIDTNCDPDAIDYPIPGNDDALKSIRLITSLITDAIIDGYKEYAAGENVKRDIEDGEDVVVESESFDGELETLEESAIRSDEEKRRGPTKVRLSTEKEK